MHKEQSPNENNPHFDANSIPPNYGYTSSQAHQSSSWACTFKGGQQVNTHIWETPLPEPQDGEYTLPASMKKQLYPSSYGHEQDDVPLASQSTNPLAARNVPSIAQTCAQPEYTMPIKMKPKQDTMADASASDYTIPVLPQPVPDTPDSESEYTVPTVNKNERQQESEPNMMKVL